jgi:hypothetical protein
VLQIDVRPQPVFCSSLVLPGPVHEKAFQRHVGSAMMEVVGPRVLGSQGDIMFTFHLASLDVMKKGRLGNPFLVVAELVLVSRLQASVRPSTIDPYVSATS